MKDQVTSQTLFEKFEELAKCSEELGDHIPDAVALFRHMCGTPGFVEHTLTYPGKDADEIRQGRNHIVPKAIFMNILDMILNRDFANVKFANKNERMKFLSDTTDIFIEGIAEYLFE